MPISPAQKTAIEEVINKLKSVTQGGRYKRSLIDAFLDLPDRESYPDYYGVIPLPRCINTVSQNLAKDEYDNCLATFDDLSLVFLNALYYNEEDSQIAMDAEKLKGILVSEWKSRQVLPTPRDSPPPESPQKKHQPTPPPAPPAPSSTSTSAPPAAPTSQPVPTTRSTTATAAGQSQPTPTTVTATTATPAPVASTSALPPLAARPRSPSPELDVERSSPEPDHEPETEGTGEEEAARDEDSSAIIAQLERSLPGWQGLEDVGWNENIREDQYLEIVTVLKNHKDAMTSLRLASVLEAIPDDIVLPDFPYQEPLSLKMIESKARSKSYLSSKTFDMDFAKLFLKGRRYYDAGSDNYGRVLLLQRFYQALTSNSPPSGPPYVSATGFASLRAGPGTARPLYSSSTDGDTGVAGVTTFRVSSKDRTFVDELQYKGWRVRLADWVHMANPDDPSRPIVGQVFRCYISDELATKGRPYLTVAWYYRPEQTFHPAHRLFWDHEVFKTSHFADHALEDLLEKVAVQFTARHIRGRPRPPYWARGWPLYVCDSRYNDRERCFVRIKNWQSCVPEEVRGARTRGEEWMPVYPFERVVYPRRLLSPFVAKGSGPSRTPKGPGGLGEPIERAEGERTEGGGTGRKRAKKVSGSGGPASLIDTYGQQKGLFIGPGPPPVPPGQQPAPQQQQPLPYGAHYSTPQASAPLQGPVSRVEDRSLIQAIGGPAAAATVTSSPLPPETTKYFDRDGQTNETLWFAAPPVNIAQPAAPKYSLAYLHFLATKRKKDASEGQNKMDADGAIKKMRMETAAELVNRVLNDAPEVMDVS